jgi:DNA-binding winged helix-turn-helix (wHTH) protein/Flp pilus assembly protein TadD/TolB-like protein
MPDGFSSTASDNPSPSRNQPDSSPSVPTVYEFGTFRLDPANRLLSSEGKEVALSGRAFDALLLLVLRPGDLVTKEEMMASVWSGSFVEESNLTVAISTLRRALNETPHDRKYIQTVARRGYRFVCEVREIREAPRRAKVSASLQRSEFAATQIRAAERTRNWPLLTGVGVLLVALVFGSWWLLKPRAPIRSLAVLPFTNDAQTPSEADEVALLGMTDGLISRLEGELDVRPTSSVLRYSGPGEAVDPVSAGRDEGVDAVLTGSLHQVAGHPVLRLRLFRVRDGLVLWQDSFDGAPNGTGPMESAAGQSVAAELHRLGAITVVPTEPVAKMERTDDPSYQLYVRGRYFWNRRTEEGLRKSADYFKQSIAANPNYAPAYAGLADSYALLASFSVEPGSSANADARSAALSAIQLDPTLAEPHASLGMIYFFTDWNFTAAEQQFEQAIRLNPHYPTAHHWYALVLAAEGRSAQALYEIRLAQKLDPLSLIIGTNVGWIEYLARDYPAATRDLRRVLEMDPNFARARTRLGIVEMATGNNAAAVEDLTSGLVLSGDEDPWVAGLLGDAQARTGNRAVAEKVLEDLRRRSASQYVPPISRALVLAGLGRKDAALEALSQAVEDHSPAMVYAKVDPALDSLRGDPGFETLVKTMAR